VDNADFKICNESMVKQNYVRYSSDLPPSFPGEKRGLEYEILSKYSYPENTEQNGYITIRFMVNCKGESGRFRLEEMDFQYQPKKFDNKVSEQILKIVKDIKGWIPRSQGEIKYDIYQYLTFRIENGQIKMILP
jgi:hypothetical protein